MGYGLLEIATANHSVLKCLRDLNQMTRIRHRTPMITEWDIELALPIHTIQAIPADAVQVYELGSTMGNIEKLNIPNSVVRLLVIDPIQKNGNEFKWFIS